MSRPHELWARFFGSSMKDDLRYTPSDCFETFPFPENWDVPPRSRSRRQGVLRVPRRNSWSQRRGPDQDLQPLPRPRRARPRIVKLRELHAAMDRAVLDAYGWSDIPTDCEFLLDYEIDEEEWGNKKKPYRYRWPDEVRDEVLARLLELNAERAKEEAKYGKRSPSTSTSRSELPAWRPLQGFRTSPNRISPSRSPEHPRRATATWRSTSRRAWERRCRTSSTGCRERPPGRDHRLLSDEDAYTIFETMNDRGLSLTPTDMLKGYLLANITDRARTRASASGRSGSRRCATSARTRTPTPSSRGCAASTPRASASARKGAAPQDFDLIGTEFHRWVRDHEGDLGLAAARTSPLHRTRLRLLRPQYERFAGPRDAHAGPGVHLLQRPEQLHAAVPAAALAPCCRIDDASEIVPQAARGRHLPRHPAQPPHLELPAHRLLDHAIRHVPHVMKDDPRQGAEELAESCAEAGEDDDARLRQERPLPTCTAEPVDRSTAPRTHDRLPGAAPPAGPLPRIHRRGRGGTRSSTSGRTTRAPHGRVRAPKSDFQEHRNRIGGLLLLPKSFNASYGDLPYAEKREHYFGQNLLAKSLHPTVRWGDYEPNRDRGRRKASLSPCGSGTPREEMACPRRLPEATKDPVVHDVPGFRRPAALRASSGVIVRAGTRGASCPQGTRSVSVFLVNQRSLRDARTGRARPRLRLPTRDRGARASGPSCRGPDLRGARAGGVGRAGGGPPLRRHARVRHRPRRLG
jgi:hypothetical protein